MVTDKEWLNNFKGMVRKLVGNSLSEFDLDDVIQDILLFILTKAKHYDSSRSSYNTFLYKGVLFCLYDIFKKKQKNKSQDVYISEYTDDVNQDSYSSIDLDNLDIQMLLDKLSEREKNIIIMSYFYGLTDGEIAKKSSLSRRQIIKIRHNILRKLKSVITK